MNKQSSRKKTFDETGPQPIPMGERLAYTVAEAAALIGVTEPHLRRFIRGGQLATVRLGRSRRVTPDAIQRFLDACAAGQGVSDA